MSETITCRQRGTETVAMEVAQERLAQDLRWGERNHEPERWLVILGEEYGEACRAVLESEPADYRHELVQVAAVAMAAIESLDRKEQAALAEAAK